MLSELRFPIETRIRQSEILNLEPKVSYRGRLAPSPTGYLHAGHALTFWRAQERCRARHGTLVLRVEDLDRDRCRPEYLEAAFEAVSKAGGTIAKPIFSFPGGRRFHFIDPSGSELAVWSDR